MLTAAISSSSTRLLARSRASAGAIPDYQPFGWNIGRFEAAMRRPERPVYLPDEVPLSQCSAARRVTVIDGRLIAEIAALFAPIPPVEFAAAELARAAIVVG